MGETTACSRGHTGVAPVQIGRGAGRLCPCGVQWELFAVEALGARKERFSATPRVWGVMEKEAKARYGDKASPTPTSSEADMHP